MSWLRRIFARPPRPERTPDVPLAASEDAARAVDDLVHWAHVWVRGGYMSRDHVADWVEDLAVETLGSAPFDADSLVAREITDLRAEQVRWPAITQWDRMDAAMEALELNGIVARQNFSCCGNCGVGEIEAEMAAQIDNGARVRGYAFFHQQDTESAVLGDGLYLSYGGLRPDDRAAERIGAEVVDAFAGAGLRPDWNGSLDRRIYLPIDWKRRWQE